MTNLNFARSHLFLQFIIKCASFLPSHILWLSQEVLRIFVSESVEIKFSTKLAQAGTVMRRYDMYTLKMFLISWRACGLWQLSGTSLRADSGGFQGLFHAEMVLILIPTKSWAKSQNSTQQHMNTVFWVSASVSETSTADVAFQRNKVPRKVEVGLSGGSHAQIPPWRLESMSCFQQSVTSHFPNRTMGFFLCKNSTRRHKCLVLTSLMCGLCMSGGPGHYDSMIN